MFAKLKFILSSIAVACMVAAAAPAAAMTVQPVVINLTPGARGMTQVVTVTNTFAYPLAVELRTEELRVDANGVGGTGREAGDLLVFPPQAMIQPGQTQSFRVQYVGDPALAQSKHFYVTVAQLPVQMERGQSAVQVLYNFQVLVSVAPQGAKPALKVEGSRIEAGEAGEAGKFLPVVTFSNPSAAHGFIANGRLRLVQRDGAGREIFRRAFSAPEIQQTIGYGLVGAGQTRHVTFPVELPSGSGTIEASFTPEN